MKITKRQLRRIIREEKQKLIKEGIREKLSDAATGSGMNLDQEVYFGLENGINAPAWGLLGGVAAASLAAATAHKLTKP